MKKLTALTLSAAIVPVLALGTVAFADEVSEGEQVDEHGMEQADEPRAGEQFLSHTPAGAMYSDDVIGKTVKQRQSGEDIGEIADLVIGEDGRILGAVITTGGFLGLGGQDVGVGWDHMEHAMEDDDSVFYVDMDEETLQNAPEHARD